MGYSRSRKVSFLFLLLQNIETLVLLNVAVSVKYIYTDTDQVHIYGAH